MDVDTPSGTNSGAGKKRFEVKKVRTAGRLLEGASGVAGAGLVLASGAGERSPSCFPHGARRSVPHRRGGRGGAVPAGSLGMTAGQ